MGHYSLGEGNESFALATLQSVSNVSLPVADFSVYHFPAINHNCKYGNVHQVLWILLVNY